MLFCSLYPPGYHPVQSAILGRALSRSPYTGGHTNQEARTVLETAACLLPSLQGCRKNKAHLFYFSYQVELSRAPGYYNADPTRGWDRYAALEPSRSIGGRHTHTVVVSEITNSKDPGELNMERDEIDSEEETYQDQVGIEPEGCLTTSHLPLPCRATLV